MDYFHTDAVHEGSRPRMRFHRNMHCLLRLLDIYLIIFFYFLEDEGRGMEGDDSWSVVTLPSMDNSGGEEEV